ncbi:APC family permease [Acinetobacter sp. IK40]|jgi:amino acid transporter|uniref:APC family permease n=1 Tax=Acinetobacter sp. IK40 TaxID=2928897 RepID=UPI002D1E9CFA|nr:APC family permease [Acinetobacter sp. IK40]MEB3793087.1 APC family permease [Acinetobacter sp. IK40]
MTVHNDKQGSRLINQVRVIGKKQLSLFDLIAIAVGLVLSQGVMVMILQGFGLSGISFFIPLIIGFLLALTYAASFAELALLIPKNGSISDYSLVATGHLPAMLSVFCGYIVVAMFAVSAELILIDGIIQQIFKLDIPYFGIGVLILLMSTGLNLLKIDIFSKVQNTLAFVMVMLLLVLGVAALSGWFYPHTQVIDYQLNFDTNTVALVALAFWGFVGAEFVAPMIEESKNASRNIPRSMYIGLTTIFITISLYGVGALYFLPKEQLVNSLTPHIEYATAVFGPSGLLFIVIGAVFATLSTLNTTLAALPRMLQGMATNKQVLSIFARTNHRNNVPWVGVLFIAFIIMIPMLFSHRETEVIKVLLTAACISWLIAYVIAHTNVMVLRQRYPQMARPYKAPFYPFLQIFGIIGMLLTIFYAVPSPELSVKVFSWVGIVIGSTTIISILWIKLAMKKQLFQPESIESLMK